MLSMFAIVASGSSPAPSAFPTAATSCTQARSRLRHSESARTPPRSLPRSVVVRAIGASSASFRHRTSGSLLPMEAVVPASASYVRMASARESGVNAAMANELSWRT